MMYQQQAVGTTKVSDAISQNIYQAARINKSKWTKSSK